MTLVCTYQIATAAATFNRPSTFISKRLLTTCYHPRCVATGAPPACDSCEAGLHMRMGFMADKLTGTARRYLEVFIDALSFLLCRVVMVYGGISITKLTMIQITASLRISMGWIYIIVPIAGLLIMVFSVMNAARYAAQRFQ
ncbi:MAG: TRAP transporter small permease [Enterocloster sp.]